MKKRIHQINIFRKFPIKSQQNVFEYLIDKGKFTSFGLEHDFKNILTYSQFCNKVPLRTYEELYPFIERIRRGEKNVLWPGRVRFYAKSSGTTNDKSKFIPISYESLKNCHYKGGKDMLSLYSNNFPDSKIYNGKGLMLGGSLSKNPKYTDGDLSAILIDNFPFWVNIHRVPKLEVALMLDWEKKLELMCKEALNSDVTNITGVSSWMLVLFQRMIDESGANNISEIWPNLELFMHGGVKFNPYKRQFEQLIANDINYVEAYNASEGFFAIQDQKNSSDLLLMLDYGIFYEFLPLSDYLNGDDECVSLKDVTVNIVYVLIISTNAGLWRYMIGDTIRFTSITPFRIKIVGRTKSYLNLVGEELMEENAETAIQIASEKYNCTITNFIVRSEFRGKGIAVHRWLVEFNVPPKSLKEFSIFLDGTIQELNSDYKSKRTDSLVLLNLEIEIADIGLFHTWFANNGKLGGQSKVPRLDSSSKIFDQITKLNTTY